MRSFFVFPGIALSGVAVFMLAACGGGGSSAPSGGLPVSSPIGVPSSHPTATASPTANPTSTPSGTPSSGPSGTPTSTPSGTPTSTPTGTSGQVSVAPGAVSFTAAPAAAVNVAISQANNSGGFSAAGCTGIVTFPATTTGTLPIAPVAAGLCTITITGSGGHTAPIAVSVTTTILNQQ